MKAKLLLIRNQLRMGNRLSFAEAMLLQRVIDVFVYQAGNSPAHSGLCPEQSGVSPAQDGNSPVIPDGYVMVPKEPTKEMIDAGWLYFMGTKNPSSKGAYKAMLAAAPQEDINALIPLVSRNEREGK
ncbi:TPA: hypothetical protein R2K58_004504 [Raoultella ornithinolytica]|nr:hypothetical protein [Raoultella ornithinolytica]HEC2621065.1 hypothetical protein [Raoultella ornithinolytica]